MYVPVLELTCSRLLAGFDEWFVLGPENVNSQTSLRLRSKVSSHTAQELPQRMAWYRPRHFSHVYGLFFSFLCCVSTRSEALSIPQVLPYGCGLWSSGLYHKRIFWGPMRQNCLLLR